MISLKIEKTLSGHIVKFRNSRKIHFATYDDDGITLWI